MSAINLTSIVSQVLFSDVTYILATVSLVALRALKAYQSPNTDTLTSLTFSLTLAATCCIISPKIVFIAHTIFVLTHAYFRPPQQEDQPISQTNVRPVAAAYHQQTVDLSYVTELKPVGIESYLVQWLEEFSSSNYPYWRLRYTDTKEFRIRVWQSVTFQLLSEGTINNQGCRKSLELNGFSLYDAETLEGISTTDWLSSREHPTYPVAIKERLNSLSSDEKTRIYCAFLGQIGAIEGPLMQLIEDITEIAKQLDHRYGRLLDLILSSQSPKTLDATIHQLLTSTLNASSISKDMLCQRELLSKVGSLVVLKLVEKTEDVTENSFVLDGQTFEFGTLQSTNFHMRILPFKVNAFTDFELQAERGIVNDQMLILSQKKGELEVWRNAILNDMPLEEAVREDLEPLTDLIITRYLMPSIRELYVTATAPTPEPKSVPDSGETRVSNPELPHKVTNDIFGDKFQAAIETWYEISRSWSLSGSCLISAVLDALNPTADYRNNTEQGYEEAQQIRSQIAVRLIENKKEWVGFFQDEEALVKHAENILDSKTYLEDIDIQILTGLVGHPIWIYKRKSGTYRITQLGQPLPTAKLGVEQTGEPILLYDDYDHYKLMKPKNIAS